MTNFSWSIPQTTLTASGYSVNLNVDRELYLTIANLGPTYGGGDVTISASWQDSSGAGQTATVIAGSTFGPSLITVRTFSVSGSGALIIGTLSSSKVSPESLLASAVNVSGTVKTDVGQGTQASNNTTLNFGGTPIDPRDRTWTLGSGDIPNRGWTLGSTDVPGRGWTLGSGDTPGRSWTLGTGDVPVIQGETPTAGTYKPIQTDANGNLLRGWSLGSTDVPGRGWSLGSGDQPDITANQSKALGTSTLPVYIRTLGATDNPKPFGSNGGAFTQDTSNNLQHVPVLQGTSTPIHTKALQYDSNNYPLHTLGNVLSGGNGGDSVINELSSSSFTATGYYNLSMTPPAGYKWNLWAIWTAIEASTGTGSPSISFTQWDFGVLSKVNVSVPAFGQTINPYWQVLQIVSGNTVTQALAASQDVTLYCGNGPVGWLNGNISSSSISYDMLALHGADFKGATLNTPLVVTPNMSVFFEVTVSALTDVAEGYMNILPMGYQEPL